MADAARPESFRDYFFPNIEILRRLLRDPKARRSFAERGRARCLADHTWERRLEFIVALLGIFDGGAVDN